jgi:hypothetical protein
MIIIIKEVTTEILLSLALLRMRVDHNPQQATVECSGADTQSHGTMAWLGV